MSKAYQKRSLPTKTKQAPFVPTAEDKKIIEKFIAFRSDPVNAQFADSKFCSEHGISLDKLSKLKTTDVVRAISSAPLTDAQMRQTVEQLIGLCFQKAVRGHPPVKSFEGLVNAFTNLLKQQRLDTGRPTEIITLEEIQSKPIDEVHQYILRSLRGVGKN